MPLDIRPHNSAPSQGQSAYSVRWALPILAENNVARVADYGCGRFRNLKILQNEFDEVDLIELPAQVKRIKELLPSSNSLKLFSSDEFLNSSKKYDAIFLISVLHTMPSIIMRRHILRRCGEKLKKGGFLIIDVPQSETYYLRRQREFRPYKDGWLMKRGNSYTFYKNYYSEELDDMTEKCASCKIYKKVRYCKHLIRIWQKA